MRTFRVIVGGNEYEVAIEEITESAPALAARQAAVPSRAAANPTSRPAVKVPSKAPLGEGTILAAIPGTITDVKVNQGDSVKRGDTLMILEAMKMENEIKAPFDGIVATIEVAKGAAVNTGMALMVLA